MGQWFSLCSMDLAENIRDQIRAALASREWDVVDLIRATGAPRSTVYSWISETRPRVPRSQYRKSLEQTLGIRFASPDLGTNGDAETQSVAGSEPDRLQLSKIPDERRADAIELAVLNQISIDYSGARLLLEIRTRRYGRFAVNSDAQGLFVVRLSSDLGRYRAGDCLTINTNMSPLPGERVCVKARGKRWIGEYQLIDGGKPCVSLWGDGGGTTEAFDLIGTVTDRSNSELERPR